MPHVHLRPYASGDLELLRGLLGDDEAMRYLGGALSEDDIAGRHDLTPRPSACRPDQRNRPGTRV